jgi:hypothetical protein
MIDVTELNELLLLSKSESSRILMVRGPTMVLLHLLGRLLFMHKWTCNMHYKIFILLQFQKSWGCNCWLNFTLNPFKILKLFRLIFGWTAKENPRSKWSVVQKNLGSPGLNDTSCLAFSFICVYVFYFPRLLVLTLYLTFGLLSM